MVPRCGGIGRQRGGKNRMSASSAGRITQRVRHDLFEKITYLSARQLDRFTIPSAVSRLTSDTYNINQLSARMQRIGVRGPILLVGGIAITLAMDLGLTLVLVGALPVIAVLVYVVTKKSVPLYTEQQSILDRMVRVVQENITGARVIKALSKTDYERRRYGRVNEELADKGAACGQRHGGDQSRLHTDFEFGPDAGGASGCAAHGRRPEQPRRDHCVFKLFYHH